MNITPDEFVLIVTGNASRELQERFLREAEQPDSEIRLMLRDAQKWASTKLNPKCPSPSDTGDAATATEGSAVRIIHRAAFANSPVNRPDIPATAEDLAAFIRGTASRKTVARVKRALADPSSEISRLVDRLASNPKTKEL